MHTDLARTYKIAISVKLRAEAQSDLAFQTNLLEDYKHIKRKNRGYTNIPRAASSRSTASNFVHLGLFRGND